MESLLGSAPITQSNFSNDPWSPTASAPTPIYNTAPIAQNDPWAAFEASNVAIPTSNNGNGTALNGSNGTPIQRTNVKTPESFLGENSSLVNLDNLMGPPIAQGKTGI